MPGRAAAAASASVAAAPFKRSQSCLRLPRGDDAAAAAAAAGKGGEDCFVRLPPPPPPRRDGDSVDDELAEQKMRVHHHAPVGVVAACTALSIPPLARLDMVRAEDTLRALDGMDWLGWVVCNMEQVFPSLQIVQSYRVTHHVFPLVLLT